MELHCYMHVWRLNQVESDDYQSPFNYLVNNVYIHVPRSEIIQTPHNEHLKIKSNYGL